MSRYWKISTGRHFQNGHHDTAQIQHCPISTPFHMWVDYDVPNWFLTSENFYRSSFSKWPLFDFNVLNWYPTSKNFYRSPFSKWPPQYRKNSTLSDIIKIRLWCPELIPDIEKFLPVAIFKMAATIPHKFNIVRFQRHFICG